MLVVLVIVNTVIFTLIALLHLYWVFGGRWASDKVIPDHLQSQAWEMGIIMRLATLAVAVGLSLFALIMLANWQSDLLPVKPEYIRYASITIGAIFLLRALGDFYYLGFFKRVKDTRFAQADTRIFSPLCLFIALVSFGIVLL